MRRGIFILFAITLTAWAFGFSAVSHAQEGQAPSEHGGSAAAAKHGAGEKAEGETSVFGQALDLGIWTIVVFLVLLWVLSRFAWQPMLEGLRRREESIRGALDEAQRAREEAKTL